MERFAREQAPERAERTDTLVWGKNAVTELLKSGGAVDTVDRVPPRSHSCILRQHGFASGAGHLSQI